MEIFENTKGFDIVLASQSPRRKQLLDSTCLPFRVEVRPVDESFSEDLLPDDVARYLSRQKSIPFIPDLKENTIVITADTIVVHKGIIMNKPDSFDEAYDMLTRLSDDDHLVITGVSVTSANFQKTFTETSKVFFYPLTDQQKKYYISNYRPFDKAGAYGIQEWIGNIAVEKIEGSWHNIVGLPVSRLVRELQQFILKISVKKE